MSVAIELSTRFDGGGANPSERDLQNAIHEIFCEDHPNLVEGDYEEHPNAWLTLGAEDGDKWTVHSLDLYRNGSLIFTKYEDQDDDEPLFERTKTNVTEPEALRLWLLLLAGNLDALETETWQ